MPRYKDSPEVMAANCHRILCGDFSDLMYFSIKNSSLQ